MRLKEISSVSESRKNPKLLEHSYVQWLPMLSPGVVITIIGMALKPRNYNPSLKKEVHIF